MFFKGKRAVSAPGTPKKNQKSISSGNSSDTVRNSAECASRLSPKSHSLDVFDKKRSEIFEFGNFARKTSNFLFLPQLKEFNRSLVPITKSLFMDAYSQSKWSLSNIKCPAALENTDLMIPPLAFNEKKRLTYALKLKNNPIWVSRLKELKRIALKAVNHYKVSSCSISLITENKQVIKYKVNLNFSECSRFISLDAHTILSKDLLIIQDCNSDWRTAENPLVKGYPFIKFYAAVPLRFETKSDGFLNVGCLAIFDQVSHIAINKDSMEYLTSLSNKLMELFKTPVHQKRSDIKSNSYEAKQYETMRLTAELKTLIGRATSTNNNSNLIFEKDGSGTSYTPNHHLYINWKMLKYNHYQSNGPSEIKKLLANVTNSKKGATIFSKFIKNKYEFDYVSIIELRTIQQFGIAPKYCPKQKQVRLKDFNHCDKLVSLGKKKLQSRILGGYGLAMKDIVLKNNKCLAEVAASDFGLIYNKDFSREDDSCIFTSALFLPFVTLTETMEKIQLDSRFDNLVDEDSFNTCFYNDSEADRYDKQNLFLPSNQNRLTLFSGCFLVFCFSSVENKVHTSKIDLINDIYADACVYRSNYCFK